MAKGTMLGVNFSGLSDFTVFMPARLVKRGFIDGYRDVNLPPYKIIELSQNKLTLENNDILMKLKAK